MSKSQTISTKCEKVNIHIFCCCIVAPWKPSSLSRTCWNLYPTVTLASKWSKDMNLLSEKKGEIKVFIE